MFDLYSCFPIAVFAAREELGMPSEGPRPLTLTGGLPFFGGAGNNYSMHAIASMVRTLRATPTATGDIHEVLCDTYGAARAAIVPGGGTYAMEAVARQFAQARTVLVIRNGFSYGLRAAAEVPGRLSAGRPAFRAARPKALAGRGVRARAVRGALERRLARAGGKPAEGTAAEA